MTKKDPHNHKKTYLKWKKKTKDGISNISSDSYKVIKQYLEDMEKGINVAPNNKKGPRSYCRLNSLRLRMSFITRELEKRFDIDKITDVKE